MKILVLGAAGGLGKALVNQALENGHEVQALVRNTANIQKTHERLKVIKGDILDAASLEPALKECDVILCAVGLKLKFRQLTTVFSKGAKTITGLMEKYPGKRLMWVTSAAVDPGELEATGFFFSKIFKPLFLEGVYADCALSEAVIKNSNTGWIIIHATRLTDGPRTGQYRVDPLRTPNNGKEISREDVADFMLKQLSDKTYLGKSPALAY